MSHTPSPSSLLPPSPLSAPSSPLLPRSPCERIPLLFDTSSSSDSLLCGVLSLGSVASSGGSDDGSGALSARPAAEPPEAGTTTTTTTSVPSCFCDPRPHLHAHLEPCRMCSSERATYRAGRNKKSFNHPYLLHFCYSRIIRVLSLETQQSLRARMLAFSLLD